jgi:hypothetical protein
LSFGPRPKLDGGSIVNAARNPLLDMSLALLLSIIAAVLRFPGLGPPSLWHDDAWVALLHRVDDLTAAFHIGTTAPGYAYVLDAMYSIFGFTELTSQLPAFLAGIAGPGLVVLLARRIGLRRSYAALSGILLAIAPFHIDFSVRVKQFTLDTLLVVALVWLAVEALDNPDRWRRWVLLGAAVLGTIFSASIMPAAVSALLAATMPALLARDWASLRWPAGYGAFAVLWAAVLRQSNVSSGLVGYWDDYASTGPGDAAAAVVRVMSAFLSLNGATAAAWLLVPVAILVGLGARRQRTEMAVLLWGPLVFATVASFAGIPLGTGRTDLYLYAPLALGLASAAQVVVVGWPPPMKLATIGAAVLLAAWTTQFARYPIQDVRPLIGEAVSLLNAGDAIVVDPSVEFTLRLYGPWPVEVAADISSFFGWRMDQADDRIHVLPWARDRATLRAHFPALEAERVLLITTAQIPGLSAWADQLLQDGGYELMRRSRSDGAVLGVYVQPLPP